MTFCVNGNAVPSRPLSAGEVARRRWLPASDERVYYTLECDPLAGGDDITCDPPATDCDVWVRFDFTDWRGQVVSGNMKIRRSGE